MTEINITPRYSGLEDKLLDISTYLNEHGIEASDVEILEAAITLAKRLGAGNWSIMCELKHRREGDDG